jgi:transcriptional regulator with XRE-family HTH domain
MTDIQKSKLCHGLKAIRKKRKITQEAAANFLEIPRTALTQIENGNRAISTLEISKLAKLYDCTVEELVAHNDIWEPWEAYNNACKKLIIAFLEKYYPEESLETVYFVGNEHYTGVFECCDRYYSIDFVQECLKLDATFEDMDSYQEHVLQCGIQNKEEGINFKTWVLHPEKRKTPEQQPFTAEAKLRQLLKKCIPALEGVTMHESLVAEIQKEIKHL